MIKGGFMKQRIIIALCLLIVTLLTVQALYAARKPVAVKHAAAAIIDPNAYPAVTAEEWGQLRWMLKLADQDIPNFTNFQSVDEQGVSASRYSIAFGAYFLAAEQYHKFPAWQETIKTAFDRINQKMLDKQVWGYWANESLGITKFEPNMDRPYAENKDPVSLGNIMYSGHLGQMINLYQMLYNERKWDAPGSIVFKWDDKTEFVYDNRKLQEVMFLQMMTNPVPGIECERNAIFPVCNLHPMLSWKLYDQMHGTRYFDAAHPLFDEFFEKTFVNRKTNSYGIIYLIKQGLLFSSWSPQYGNKMDGLIKGMVAKGANFNSASIDGWTGTFMHAWNPKLVESLYPYRKKFQVIYNPDGTVNLRKDNFAPDAYWGFFTMGVAEMGDTKLLKALHKAADKELSPVWIDGTYHYQFADKTPTVNLAAADSDKSATPAHAAPMAKSPAAPPAPADDAKGGICCNGLRTKEHGNIGNMKTWPQHADLVDRQMAISRALPKSGMWTMHNKPFDAAHFTEPAITGIDVKKTALKRAIYDRSKKALIVSTMLGKPGAGDVSFNIVNLDLSKTYKLIIDGKKTAHISSVKEYVVTLDGAKAHDLILIQI